MMHKKKGARVQTVMIATGRADGEMAEDIAINAKINQNKRLIRSTKTKNMTNYKW